jgi:monolysocardiolipin acyltransferase
MARLLSLAAGMVAAGTMFSPAIAKEKSSTKLSEGHDYRFIYEETVKQRFEPHWARFGLASSLVPFPDVSVPTNETEYEQCGVFPPEGTRDSFVAPNTFRSVGVIFFGTFFKLWITRAQDTKVYHGEKLVDQVLSDRGGRGLITVMNHTSFGDDPQVICAILPYRCLQRPSLLRWTLCADNLCFSNAFLSRAFHLLKNQPVKRGAGVNQRQLESTIDVLNQGDWVHLFPEGYISQGKRGAMKHFRPGVSRLLLDSSVTPLVVPCFHLGMDDAWPVASPIPFPRRSIRIIVGDAIDFTHVKERWEAGKISLQEAYTEITDTLEETLLGLREELMAQIEKDEGMQLWERDGYKEAPIFPPVSPHARVGPNPGHSKKPKPINTNATH